MEIVIIIVTKHIHACDFRWSSRKAREVGISVNLKLKLTVRVEPPKAAQPPHGEWNLRASLRAAPLGLSKDFCRADTV